MRHRSIAPFSFAAIAFALVATSLSLAQDAESRKLTSATFEQDDAVLVVSAESAEPWDFSSVQVLIDTDTSAKTGYTVAGMPQHGFDVMVERANVFRHEGPQAEWGWKQVGQATRSVSGNKLVTEIDVEALKSQKVSILLRTLSADWQQVIDTAPKSGPKTLDLATPAAAQPTEKLGDADKPNLDITSVSAEQVGGQLVVTVETKAPSDFATALVFFDADANADTGYLPPAKPKFGFDLLINGPTLSRFTGATRDAWTWEPAGDVTREVVGNKLTLKLNAGLLGTGDSIGLGVWMMSGDWQTLVDAAPDNQLYDVKIDRGKVEAPATRPAVAMAEPRANRHLPARQRVKEAKSYYCYYGANKVEELSHYDIAILHTPAATRQSVQRLKDVGVVTIGYITVGEDHTVRKGDGLGPGGSASWYFDKDNDGAPDRNGIWNSYYANPNNPAWRADRVEEARRLIEDVGFDGIFLDTLDTVQLYPGTDEGMIQLVRDFRDRFPEAPIVLNQGYSLLPRLAPICDAMMLESFTTTFDFASQQYVVNYPSSMDAHLRRVNQEILPVIKEHPLRVLILDYALEYQTERIQMAADRATTLGFLFAAAPIYLDQVYANTVTGRYDERWLHKQATPENLSITLEKPANGFPAGTQILPSGSYAGYRVDAVVDEVEDRSTLHWSRAAWASAEDGEEAWLEFRFPRPRTGGQLQIQFHAENGKRYPSHNYRVEIRGDKSSNWTEIAHVVANEAMTVAHALPRTPYAVVRIHQSPTGGSLERPNLLWISQVRLLQ